MKKILLTIILLLTMANISANARVATLEEKVTGLYVAIVSRAPDESGLNWWKQRGEEALKEGKSISDVVKELAKRFSGHPTFLLLYDGLGNRAFVEAIYRNSLGREGDPGGITYWSGELGKGLSRSDMVAIFVETALEKEITAEAYPDLSDEELAEARQKKDIFRNKVKVALAFVDKLGTLTNVTDTQNPRTDPAYLASIKIISEVTEDLVSVTVVLDFLDQIKGGEDPIARINHDCAASNTLTTDTNYGDIAAAGEINTYKVIITDDRVLKLYSTGGLDTKASLYDSAGIRLASNDDASYIDRNFLITYDVAPGEYCLEVEAFDSSATGGYDLYFKPIPRNHENIISTTREITYDLAGRVVSEDYGDGLSIEYVYDESGNLIKQTVVK